MAKIIVVGLGPGHAGLITRESWEVTALSPEARVLGADHEEPPQEAWRTLLADEPMPNAAPSALSDHVSVGPSLNASR